MRFCTVKRCWSSGLDVMRLLDYIETRMSYEEADRVCRVSGGGTTTLFTAALDQRIACAVCQRLHQYIPRLTHGDSASSCNYVPGILQYAELADVAGLIAATPAADRVRHTATQSFLSRARGTHWRHCAISMPYLMLRKVSTPTSLRGSTAGTASKPIPGWNTGYPDCFQAVIHSRRHVITGRANLHMKFGFIPPQVVVSLRNRCGK